MSIIILPDDIFYLISNYIDYFSIAKFKITCKRTLLIKDHYYYKKANIIKKFFNKYIFQKFADLKSKNRKGHLINLNTILNNPQKYVNIKIQCISWFQYNFSYLPKGYIVEGYIHCLNDAWIISDIDSNKIHPLIDPFIFPKSIRMLI